MEDQGKRLLIAVALNVVAHSGDNIVWIDSIGDYARCLDTWRKGDAKTRCSFTVPGMENIGKVYAVLAALTVVITAAYILWTLQRVYLGTNPAYKDYKDINTRELLCVIPLVVLAVALGVLPQQLVLNWMEPHVTALVDSLVGIMR